MTFTGRFSDSLVAERLEQVSLSFLVDDLEIRRGGIAANISFGLANLGVAPHLVGAVGRDWLDYESWLQRAGVLTDHVLVSDTQHTARFVCTTDADHAQIASFYPGAMSEARNIELHPLAETLGGLDLVLIGANDPVAMQRHTDECRERGYPFLADPSQQLAWLDGPAITDLIDGAAYLFTNNYEASIIEQKTGWTEDEITARVGVRVITHGAEGASVITKDSRIEVPVAKVRALKDPTGVGDGFRAGFIAGLNWGLSFERCAQLGSLLAAYVIETVGTQEYEFTPSSFVERFGEAYGAEAAADLEGRFAKAA